jgi:hypothetical protein
MPERRRHRRYGTSQTGEAMQQPSNPFVVEIVNVSESGLGVVSVRDLDVGGEYYFRLPDWNRAPLKGVVRWVENYGGPTYAGVELVELSDEAARALRELVAKYDRSDWGTE